MKRKLIITLIAASAALAGCSTVPIASTSSATPLEGKTVSENLGKVKGSDSALSILGLYMIGRPDIDAAMKTMSEAFTKPVDKSAVIALKARLDAVGIRYEINHKLVRGLDYYNRSVFEWVTDKLGAQGTVCAGGRYDGLVTQLGGKPTPGVGFAMGVERLILLLETLQLPPEELNAPADLYLCAFGEAAELAGLALAERLRDAIPGLRLLVNSGGGSFKSQFKKADKSGARFALILGEDELAARVVGCKPLRDDAQQQNIGWDALPAHLAACLQA